ncbi:hypothetical protein [Aeropyrum pernix]|nr:hypothetical protein [Aeropyrum pernix]
MMYCLPYEKPRLHERMGLTISEAVEIMDGIVDLAAKHGRWDLVLAEIWSRLRGNPCKAMYAAFIAGVMSQTSSFYSMLLERRAEHADA